MRTSVEIPTNPQALLGNPARTVPAPGQSSAVPLDLNAAQAAGFPDTIPYPWPEAAQLTDQSKIDSNEQAGLDFGVVTYLVNWQASNPGYTPTTETLQGIANKSGVIFSYTIEGEPAPVIYTPGAYFPGE